jgi:hypothetical protein
MTDRIRLIKHEAAPAAAATWRASPTAGQACSSILMICLPSRPLRPEQLARD